LHLSKTIRAATDGNDDFVRCCIFRCAARAIIVEPVAMPSSVTRTLRRDTDRRPTLAKELTAAGNLVHLVPALLLQIGLRRRRISPRQC